MQREGILPPMANGGSVAAAPAGPNPAGDAQGHARPTLGLLKEDDEFEEFPIEDWGQDQVDQADITLWDDNWDNDNVDDAFSHQLRAELSNLEAQPAGASTTGAVNGGAMQQ